MHIYIYMTVFCVKVFSTFDSHKPENTLIVEPHHRLYNLNSARSIQREHVVLFVIRTTSLTGTLFSWLLMMMMMSLVRGRQPPHVK